MRKHCRKQTRGFTLTEVVVVVLIIGMLASMAIPRISQAANGASGAALVGDLMVVRKALIHYAAEHDNDFPGPSADRMVQQLTQYSDRSGHTAGIRTKDAPYGPYLAQIPECPIGYNPGSREIVTDTNSPPKPQPATTAGWVYNPDTGEFYPNASADDVAKHLPAHMQPAEKAGGEVSGMSL